MTRPSLDLAILRQVDLSRDFESEEGSIPVEAIVETGTAWRAPTRRGASYFILPAIPRVVLLVFLLVSAAIDEETYFTFKWLWQWSSIGQGHQDENTNRNNNLNHWFDSIFLGKFSKLVENVKS